MYLVSFMIMLSSYAFAHQQLNTFYHSNLKDANKTRIERLLSQSQSFLGAQYSMDPLGEHEKDGPTISSENFDCVTYVDTVLALSIAQSDSHFEQVWEHLRYQNTRHNLLERNHFTEYHWLRKVQPWLSTWQSDALNQSTIQVNLRIGAWYDRFCQRHKFSTTLCEKYIKQKDKLVTIPYIAKHEWLHNKNTWQSQLPQFAVVLVINKPNPKQTEIIGSDLAVSHLGFLYRAGDRLRFRHASSVSRKVVDVDFIDYVKSRWHSEYVIGYSLLEVTA